MDQNDAASQAATWKRKYYDALEQQETKERQWTQADDLLRKTISRLTLAADGLDDALDTQLKALRDAIRDRAEPRILKQRIEAMSESLVRLDAKRADKSTAPRPASALQSLLDKIEFPRGHARQLKAVRKQLESADDDDLAPAITQFAKLLQEMLSAAKSADKTEVPGTSGGGLLGRLFGRGETEAVSENVSAAPSSPEHSTIAQPTSPASTLGGARDLLLHVLDQFQGLQPKRVSELRSEAMRAASEAELKRLAEALAAEFRVDLPQATEEQACGSEILLQLLQRLDLPTDLAPKVEAIKDQCEDRANFDAPKVLRDLATLIADMRARLQREKEEIESFLKQLTDRLQDIDSHVRGAETARVESYRSGIDLGDAVQEQVRGIESSVLAAEALDVLKQTVQRRIDAILDHVEQHRVKEELRNNQVEAQVRDLTTRIGEMESESAKLRERIHEERSQALTDALTGIPNRLAYEERVAQEFARWKRFATPLALLVWDVDNFKMVNDRYGHKAGDKVLKVIAETLAEKIRETDFLARYGGEEFVLVMTGTTQPAILEVADKLRQAVETCGFHFRGESVNITISCGIAEFREGDSIETVFERADAALYKAKEAGRNRCISAGS